VQAEFQHFLHQEVALTTGKVPAPDEVLSATTVLAQHSHRQSASWLDVSDAAWLRELDEHLVCLSCHVGMWVSVFRQFLVERFCSENAVFYAEADDYRRLPGGPAYRALRARRIYDKYIDKRAKLQVNLRSEVAKELNAVLGPSAAAAHPGGTVSVPGLSRPPSTLHSPSSQSRGGVPSSAAAAAPSGSHSSLMPPRSALPARSPSGMAAAASAASLGSAMLVVPAQREIFLLIQADSHKPFIESQPFKNYKQACQAKITL